MLGLSGRLLVPELQGAEFVGLAISRFKVSCRPDVLFLFSFFDMNLHCEPEYCQSADRAASQGDCPVRQYSLRR